MAESRTIVSAAGSHARNAAPALRFGVRSQNNLRRSVGEILEPALELLVASALIDGSVADAGTGAGCSDRRPAATSTSGSGDDLHRRRQLLEAPSPIRYPARSGFSGPVSSSSRSSGSSRSMARSSERKETWDRRRPRSPFQAPRRKHPALRSGCQRSRAPTLRRAPATSAIHRRGIHETVPAQSDGSVRTIACSTGMSSGAFLTPGPSSALDLLANSACCPG